MPREDLLVENDEYVFVQSENSTEKSEEQEFDDYYEECGDIAAIKNGIEKLKQEQEELPNPKGIYSPTALNRTILRIFKNKFSHVESVSNENPDSDPNLGNLVYNIFKNKDQKIILFNVVTEFTTSKDPELTPLAEALSYLKNSNFYTADDIVIMPITEPYRGLEQQGHFRLISFVKDNIVYYDSKSAECNLGMRFMTPFRSAIKKTLEDVAEKIAGTVGYTEQLLQMASSVLRFPSNYAAYFDVVRTLCKKHFPDRPFSECALAYQAWYEHTDCGAIAITAGVSIASGIEPPPPSVDTQRENLRAALELRRR